MPCCGSRRSKQANRSKSQTNLNDRNGGLTFHTSSIIRRPGGQQYQPCSPPPPQPIPYHAPCQYPAAIPNPVPIPVQQCITPIPSPRPSLCSPRPVQPSPRPYQPSPMPSNRCPIHYSNEYLNVVNVNSHAAYLPELEGDIDALSLIDLDRYGLSGYKYLLSQNQRSTYNQVRNFAEDTYSRGSRGFESYGPSYDSNYNNGRSSFIY